MITLVFPWFVVLHVPFTVSASVGRLYLDFPGRPVRVFLLQGFLPLFPPTLLQRYEAWLIGFILGSEGSVFPFLP